jgi:8-oxo-dGTP diphosphatase
MQLLLVRHGHAEPKEGWDQRDEERPLVSRGVRQAKSLARELAQYQPARILSSPAIRCQDTIEPLAEARGLKVELCDALARDAGARALDLIDHLVQTSPADPVVVVCSHREVIVEVLPGLTRESGVEVPHRLPGAKGSTWVLHFQGSGLVTVGYRPAKS